MGDNAQFEHGATEDRLDSVSDENSASTPFLSIASPCYNEADGISDVIHEWNKILDAFDFESEIVLCNDGSTDHTRVILEDLMRSCPRLRVVELPKNGGYGRALSTAINATRGDYIATIDSDGQFDLADAKRLLDVARERNCDFVTGYRHKKEDSMIRVLANHGLNLLVRIMFGVHLRDTNCALKVARGNALRGLEIESSSFATPTEICLRVIARGLPVAEVRVSHRARAQGASKIKTAHAIWGFSQYLLYLRIKLFLYRTGVLNSP